MKLVSFQEIPREDQDLLLEAERVAANAYCPYSNFSVGAAIRAKNGKIFVGCNMENASWGNTICAERSALAFANAMGVRDYHSIAIIAKGGNPANKEPVTPCGACRQSLYEFSQLYGTPIQLILSNSAKNRIKLLSIEELLPMAFGPKDLLRPK